MGHRRISTLMRWRTYVIAALVVLVAVIAALLLWTGTGSTSGVAVANGTVALPAPDTTGQVSVEQAIAQRRSVRDFTDQAPTVEQLSQLLWSAQGLTGVEKRAAPSAGMTYPLELYLAVGPGVGELEAGVYRYVAEEHILTQIGEGDVRSALASAAMDQQWVREAPVNVVIAADYSRTTSRYGERGRRYVHMEAGHAAQNMYLQAEALDLGMVVVGAFSDSRVQETLHMDADHEPLYVIPLGYPA